MPLAQLRDRVRRCVVLASASLALANCAARESSPAGGAEPLRLTGRLTYLARIALPPDAMAVVALRDVTAGESAPAAEERIRLEGRQVPVAFELRVERKRLTADHAYELRGEIVAAGRTRWTTGPVHVDVTGTGTDLGELRMTPAAALLLQGPEPRWIQARR